jgi:hypothetical protein
MLSEGIFCDCKCNDSWQLSEEYYNQRERLLNYEPANGPEKIACNLIEIRGCQDTA